MTLILRNQCLSLRSVLTEMYALHFHTHNCSIVNRYMCRVFWYDRFVDKVESEMKLEEINILT